MADRTVAVNLTAQVAGYVTNMRAAQKATLDVTKSTSDAKAALEKHSQSLKTIGVGMLGVGAIAAVGIGLVVKAASDFGAKMAQLQALSHAGSDDMKRLADAAMSAGTAYGFSATQVADAQIEMSKAGVSVKDMLGGALTGTLQLAAAGQIDLGQATQIATVAMTQFQLKAGDIPHLADLLAAGADKALGSVGDLGQAFANGGLQAHNMGMTVDQTVGILAEFANAGIIGAEAGTQLSSMMIRIEKPMAAAKKAMAEYNITMYDGQGKFIGMSALAGELHDKLSKLTAAQRNAALGQIFGSYAIKGATVLYQDGAKKVGDWVNAVNDSGFASAQAAGKMNSLQGDTQKLTAAVQTDMIKMGSSAQGALRGVVQSVTGVANAFGNLPAPVQGGIVIIGGLTAGIGLLGGAMILAIPKIAEFKLALTSLGATGRGLAGLLGKGGAILAGVVDIGLAFTALGDHGTASSQQVELAAVKIRNSWTGIDKLFGSAGSTLTSGKGLKASLDELGDGSAMSSAGATKIFDALTFGIAHLSDVYKSNEGTFDAMGQQLAGLAKQNYGAASRSFSDLVSKYKLGGEETKNLLNNMPAFKAELVALAGKSHIAATDQNLLNLAQGRGKGAAKVLAQSQADAANAAAQNATQLAKLTGSGNDATTSMKDLHDALANLGSTELDSRSAARAFQQAIDDATKAAAKNGKALNINTQAGRDNQAALDGIAKAAAESAAAYVQNGGSAAGAAKIIAAGRSAYIKTAESMGLSKDQANRLADALHLIPKSVSTAAKITGGQEAINTAYNIRDAIKSIQSRTVTIAAHYVQTGQNMATGGPKFAAGGAVGGRGPKGVDSVPALLAPGEHVWMSSEVDAIGGQSAMYRLRAAARAGALPRFAKGGHVTPLTSLRTNFEADLAAGRYDSASKYVTELDKIAKDTKDFSAVTRKHYAAIAGAAAAAIKKLETSSSAAATKLKDLKSAADQLKSQTASAITGGYSLSNASQATRASGWAYQNGIRYQTYTTGPTAGGIAAYYKAGAAGAKKFATDLAQLRKEGYPASLLAEVAGYGVEQGAPIAQALIHASKSDRKTIEAGYGGIAKYANAAGKTVGDAQFQAQLHSASKNTHTLVTALAKEGAALRKVIGHALHVPGYASGTLNASQGVRWVGENGPELAYFRGGEKVIPRAWMSGKSNVTVMMPDTITVQDASGFTATMRVVAGQEIRAARRADYHASFGRAG